MPRRRLVLVALLLSGCSTARLADAVPAPSSSAAGPATTSVATTAVPVTSPTLTAPRPLPTNPPANSPGAADALPTVPATGPESTELVGDPGSEDPACPVPVRRSPDPMRPRYRATVVADPTTGTVDGQLTVQMTPDQPIDRVFLRLWANSPRIAEVGGRIDVGSATAGGLPAPLVQRDPTTVAVVLPSLLAAGGTVTVAVQYHLTIPAPSGDRVSLDGDALRLGSFLPLVPWEPGGQGWDLEQPTSGFAEAATSPAADWDVTVSAPAGYTVLGTGTPQDGGRWLAVGARDMAFTIGRLSVVQATANAPHPVTVTVGVQDGVEADPAEFAARVVDALQAFALRFGAYPWRSYTLGITAGLNGGIEFPGHVMQGPETLGRTTTHEVAHQWFYALVGNNQARNPVLDEGLASYAELSHEGTLVAARDWLPPPEVSMKAGQGMSFWEQHLDAYYLGVYVQGARGLDALGPTEEVDCALRRYVAENALAIATPAKLLAALSTVFPNAVGVLVPYGIG